jgi:hypothetical protein
LSTPVGEQDWEDCPLPLLGIQTRNCSQDTLAWQTPDLSGCYCAPITKDGNWPLTLLGQTYSLPCQLPLVGNQTRSCDGDIGDWGFHIDNSGCACAADGIWPQTLLGQEASAPCPSSPDKTQTRKCDSQTLRWAPLSQINTSQCGCESDGDWPAAPLNTLMTLPCAHDTSSLVGNRIRLCDQDGSYQEEDTSNCECPQSFPWPNTRLSDTTAVNCPAGQLGAQTAVCGPDGDFTQIDTSRCGVLGSITSCAAVDTWPNASVGDVISIPCGVGLVGNQTRFCDVDGQFSPIQSGGCSCVGDSFWPITPLGVVARIACPTPSSNIQSRMCLATGFGPADTSMCLCPQDAVGGDWPFTPWGDTTTVSCPAPQLYTETRQCAGPNWAPSSIDNSACRCFPSGNLSETGIRQFATAACPSPLLGNQTVLCGTVGLFTTPNYRKCSCPPLGRWPSTQLFKTANISCDSPLIGYQTRECTPVTLNWSDRIKLHCFCPAQGGWPSVPVGQPAQRSCPVPLVGIMGGFCSINGTYTQIDASRCQCAADTLDGDWPKASQNQTVSIACPGNLEGSQSRNCSLQGYSDPDLSECSCPQLGNWPPTPRGSTASISCGTGQTGTAKRLCSALLNDWVDETAIDWSQCSCDADGIWPEQPSDSVATLPCPNGLLGIQTRICSAETQGWAVPDLSGCECAASSDWPQTRVGATSPAACSNGLQGVRHATCLINNAFGNVDSSTCACPAETLDGDWPRSPVSATPVAITCAVSTGMQQRVCTAAGWSTPNVSNCHCNASDPWPETPAGQVQTIPCPGSLLHNQTRVCTAHGWETTKDINRSACSCPADGVWQETPLGESASIPCTAPAVGVQIRLCHPVLLGWEDVSLTDDSNCMCAGDGDWPATQLGQRAEITCPSGLIGLRGRVCNLDGTWGVAEMGDCYCEAEVGDGASWPQTPYQADVTVPCKSKGAQSRTCEASGFTVPDRTSCGCAADGNWPQVMFGTTMYLNCPTGQVGLLSRTCSEEWGAVQSSGCSCSSDTANGTTWDQTLVGQTDRAPCPSDKMGYLTRACSAAGWAAVVDGCVPRVASPTGCPAEDDWPQTAVNGTVTLNCLGNLTGQRTRMCDATGIWDFPDVSGCMCPSDGVSGATTAGQMSSSSCPGELMGQVVRFCDPNLGTWSPSEDFSQCSCQDQAVSVPFGASVVSSCPTGLQGNQTSICSLDGFSSVVLDCSCPADGTWASVPYGFQATMPCPLGELDNITRLCSSSGWDSVANGACACQATPPFLQAFISTQVTAPCPSPQNGTQSRWCNSSSGMFDGPDTSLCACGRSGDWPRTLLGQMVTIPCDIPSSGTQTRQCKADGTFGEIVAMCSCVAEDDWPETPSGQSITLACPFDMTGMQTRGCGNDGVWQTANLSACVCVEQDGWPATGFNSTSQLPCTVGVGAQTRRCTLTGWSGLAETDDSCSCPSVDGWPQTLLNQAVTIDCGAGLSGNMTRFCLSDGTFSDIQLGRCMCPSVSPWPETPTGATIAADCPATLTGVQQRVCGSQGFTMPSGCQCVVDGEWPRTPLGTNASINCPGLGNQTRLCDATNNSWSNIVDTTNCACATADPFLSAKVGQLSFATCPYPLSNSSQQSRLCLYSGFFAQPDYSQCQCGAETQPEGSAVVAWPATFVGQVAVVPCQNPFLGNQTRRCPADLLRWDSPESVDESACMCPATSGWPATPLGLYATQQCPPGMISNQTAQCSENGTFTPADQRNCKCAPESIVIGSDEFDWPVAEVGTVSSLSCPNDLGGVQTRTCTSNGYTVADYSACFCEVQLEWNTTFVNHSTSIPCPPAYIGNQSRSCSSAGWSDPVLSGCSCPAQDGWPAAQLGTNSSRTCPSGAGTQVKLCMETQGWSNTIIDVDCMCPVTTDFPVSPLTLVGQIVKLTCLPGQYNGSIYRSCSATGWDVPNNTCAYPDCQAESAFGYNWPTTPSGQTAFVSCNSSTGTKSRACLQGAWQLVSQNKCVPPPCPADGIWPQTPAGTQAVQSVPPPYGCQVGLPGSLSRLCNDSGLWETVVNACNQTDCPSDPPFNETAAGLIFEMPCPNGSTYGKDTRYCAPNGTSGNWQQEKYTCAFDCPSDDPWPQTSPDTTASVVCPSGQIGYRARYCTAQGLWENEANSTCHVPSCGPDATVGNITWPLTQPGTTATEPCDLPFVGNQTRVCFSNGLWDTVSTRACQLLPPAPCPGDGVWPSAGIGELVELGCPAGQLLGSWTRQCFGPVWYPPVNTCAYPACAAEDAFGFAWPSTPNDNYAVVSCSAMGAGWAGNRTRLCHEGAWQLISQVPCVPPPCPADGIWPQTNSSEQVVSPSPAPFGCPTGQPGAVSRVCGNETGVWDTVVNTCGQSDCPADGEWIETPAGIIAKLPCPTGSTSGERSRVCRTNGTSGVWQDETDTCASDCAADGDWPETAPGTTASLSCQAGEIGYRWRVCTSAGLWEVEGATTCRIPDCGFSNVFAGVAWPETQPGVKRILPCPPPATGGNESRTCSSAGVWQIVDKHSCVTPISPTSSPTPSPTGGDCLAIDSWPQTAAGDFAVLPCGVGQDGSITRFCDFTGSWEDVEDTCAYPDCQSEVWDDVMWPETASGDSAVVSCGEIHILEGIGWSGSRTRLCLQGAWQNPSLDDCVAPPCLGDRVWPQTPAGQTAQLTGANGCPAGEPGSITRFCNETGSWMAVVNACNQTDCPAIDGWNQTSAGLTANHSCPANSTYGEDIRYCKPNGTAGVWQDENNTCASNCSGSEFGSALPDSTNSLPCPNGQIGYRFDICLQNGTYLPPNSTCRIPDCGQSPVGSTVWPATPPNTIITINCTSPFAGTQSRTCSPTGVWGSVIGRCLLQPTPAPSVSPTPAPGSDCLADNPWPRAKANSISVLPCDVGQDGSMTRVCNGQGLWQPFVNTCAYPDCAAEVFDGVPWPTTVNSGVVVVSCGVIHPESIGGLGAGPAVASKARGRIPVMTSARHHLV